MCVLRSFILVSERKLTDLECCVTSFRQGGYTPCAAKAAIPCGLTVRKRLQEQKIQNLEVFIKRVKKYTTLKELTPYALRELVKGIYVEAPDKSSGKRKQKAHIEYDLVGFIPVDKLMKAEKV